LLRLSDVEGCDGAVTLSLGLQPPVRDHFEIIISVYT
jgi:hypothetical protein